MKKIYLILVLFVFVVNDSFSQTYLSFTVNQPEPLSVTPESQFFTIQPDDIPFSIGDVISVTDGNPDYSFLWTPGAILSEDDVLNPEIISMGIDSTSDTLYLTIFDEKECIQNTMVIVTYDVPVEEEDTTGLPGINKHNHLEKAKVYPNPLQETLFIEFESDFSNHIDMLQVYDVQKRLVFTKSINRNPNSETLTIDFSAWSTGLYQLILVSENQQFFYSIIKE